MISRLSSSRSCKISSSRLSSSSNSCICSEDLRSALAALSLCIKDHLGSTPDPALQHLTRLTDRRLQYGRSVGISALMWLADHSLVAPTSDLGTTVLREYLSQRLYTRRAQAGLRRLISSSSSKAEAEAPGVPREPAGHPGRPCFHPHRHSRPSQLHYRFNNASFPTSSILLAYMEPTPAYWSIIDGDAAFLPLRFMGNRPI